MEDLIHWEQAPLNPLTLEKAGVKIALTAHGLKDPGQFIKRIRQLHALGMSKESILKAITTTPAELFAINNTCGALKKGMLANFIVTDEDLFDERSSILQNWVKGTPYQIAPRADDLAKGAYSLTIGNDTGFALNISGNETSLNGTVSSGTDTTKASVSLKAGVISISFEFQKGPKKGVYHLTGYRNQKGFEGKTADLVAWKALYEGDITTPSTAETDSVGLVSPGKIRFPAMAYGFSEMPKPEKTLIRNATVWTNEKEGKLDNTDVLIDKGKIAAIGKSLPAGDAIVIDGSGLHLTAGIIDEHSHIAVSQSVNECSHAITSEVRIGDVINPDDINIYRQLSGGVTTSQLLHGSCNPIGGQSGLIKLRWGRSAEEMKFENAPGFIKFALGENVKQANWGDDFRSRYPQSRMGVEQVYVDAFTRAVEYDNRRKAASGKKTPSLFRRDLRMEALAEIMDDKRHITCHSYQQGEITMLMRVADSLGFKVNTFTHILEGYKIADKMKEHGVGASSFSDWWAYKYEVIEAIPHNGSILHDVGVTVAFNSDDAEMARRLNQEAAKAVRYGGISEEEALKFVTLNPAKLLRIDDRVGSIRIGKDADLVLWSENPLSVYAKAKKTFIDGICYYDSNRDLQMRTELENERLRIMRNMQNANKKGGSETRNPSFKNQKLFHCMDEEEDHH
jgi:imidazolonepropionase-like amidohydrolase